MGMKESCVCLTYTNLKAFNMTLNTQHPETLWELSVFWNFQIARLGCWGIITVVWSIVCVFWLGASEKPLGSYCSCLAVSLNQLSHLLSCSFNTRSVQTQCSMSVCVCACLCVCVCVEAGQLKRKENVYPIEAAKQFQSSERHRNVPLPLMSYSSPVNVVTLKASIASLNESGLLAFTRCTDTKALKEPSRLCWAEGMEERRAIAPRYSTFSFLSGLTFDKSVQCGDTKDSSDGGVSIAMKHDVPQKCQATFLASKTCVQYSGLPLSRNISSNKKRNWLLRCSPMPWLGRTQTLLGVIWFGSFPSDLGHESVLLFCSVRSTVKSLADSSQHGPTLKGHWRDINAQ